MRILLALLVSALTVCSFSSCEKIPCPYPNCEVQPPPPPEPHIYVAKNILLEDLTGFLCQGCPAAHQKMEQLNGYDYSPSELFLASIHVSMLAEPPIGTSPNDPFGRDLRTDSGAEYDEYWSVSTSASLPHGFINRTEYNNAVPIPYSSWETALSLLIDDSVHFDMELVMDYSATDRKLTADVTVDAINYDLNADLSLVMYVLEDNIITGQVILGEPTDYNYSQMHVLRATPLGTWGIPFVVSQLKENDPALEHSIEYNLESDMVDTEISVVFYLRDESTHEILQVVGQHLL